MPDTVCSMISHLPDDTVVVGDGLFGTIGTATKLIEKKKDFVLSTPTKNARFVYNHPSHKDIRPGSVANSYGKINNVTVQFNTAKQHDEKLINTTSSIGSGAPASVTRDVQVLEKSDGADNDEFILRERPCTRSEVRNIYQDAMDLVDKVDQLLSKCFIRNKKFHWTSPIIMWLVNMLMLINCKKLYESASGNVDVYSNNDWLGFVKRQFSGQNKVHDRIKFSNSDKRCRLCSRRSRYICEACGPYPICKQCFEEKHDQFNQNVQNRNFKRRAYK